MAAFKRSDLVVFWQVSDDGGFWRVDGMAHRKGDLMSEPAFKIHREFEKKSFEGDESVGNILKRANGYLDWLIGQGKLDAWYSAPVNAAP